MARSAQKAVGVRLSMSGAEEVKRALEQLGERGEKALRHLEDGGRGASAGLKAVDTASTEVQSGLRNVAGRAGPVGTALAGIGTKGLLAAAGIGALVLATGKALQIAREAVTEFDELGKKIRDLGIDSDLYQGLQFAALETGVGDRLDEALRTFNIRSGQAIYTETGELVEKLKQLDPVLLQNIRNATSFEERLDLVANKLASTTNATEFATLSALAFGEGNIRVGQILADGADGIDRYIDRARELGLVISRDVLANAERMENQFDVAARVVDLNLKQAFIDLAPILVSSAELIATVARGIGILVDKIRELQVRTDLPALQVELANTVNERIGLLETLREKQQFINDMGPSNPSAQAETLAIADLETRLDDLTNRALALTDRIQILQGRDAAPDGGSSLRNAKSFARLSADVDRTLQSVANKAEQIAAVRAELEQTVAQFEALRGKEGVDKSALDAQIANAREAAARQLARINGTGGGGGSSPTDEEARRLERLAETWRSKVTPALDAHLALLADLDAARTAGFLNETEYLAALTQAQRDYSEVLAEQRRTQLKSSNSLTDGMLLGLDRIAERAGTVAETMADAMVSATDKSADAFADLVVSGKADFGELARSIIADTARMFAQQGFRQLIGGLAGGFAGTAAAGAPIDLMGGGGGGMGGFISGLFDGMFATGGYIRPGHWGMAGERGPEPVFGGRTGATVLPAGGQSGPTIIQHFSTSIDASGSTMRPAEFEALLDERDRRNAEARRSETLGWVDDRRKSY